MEKQCEFRIPTEYHSTNYYIQSMKISLDFSGQHVQSETMDNANYGKML